MVQMNPGLDGDGATFVCSYYDDDQSYKTQVYLGFFFPLPSLIGNVTHWVNFLLPKRDA